MKRILHLVCNSHLDPVWQWDWDEGASAALATFYAACNLLDKYDFIFCHNEVILYEYIEKYDHELFVRIQKLVEQRKWKIMGGWYCQPDCAVPSGESFIRQSSLGREYFKEKFNARPTTALNFDSFAHTRGLPEILKKCGFDSYIFCRPMPYHHKFEKEDLPHGPFLWKGYDGSVIKALRFEDLTIYCSQYGKARADIERKMSNYSDLDKSVILWGVGNHGGVSSAQDLEDIMELQNEKKGEWEIIHSTLEDYFASVNPTKVVNRQFITFLKSYSSVNAIKLAHDQLENALYFTEKVCSIADIGGKRSYNKEVLKDAERVLCQIEFHDVLSGTAIKTGTYSSIRKAHHAIEDLKAEMFASFVALTKDLPTVTPRDDNLVFINPFPYEFNDYVEAEFFIEDGRGIEEKEHYFFELTDNYGNIIPYQTIQAETNVNVDRRKRLVFKLKIPATSVASVQIHKTLKEFPWSFTDTNEEIIEIKDSIKTVKISRKTGLMESFVVNGKEYLSSSAFLPVMFNDNEDPWGWNINCLDDEYTEDTYPLHKKGSFFRNFKLDDSGKGVFNGITGVHVIEKGDLVTEVESVFSKNESHVVINYKIYKDSPTVDIKIRTLWNEPKKGLKIKVPVAGESKYFAQMAFGIEKYKNNGLEYPSNRYVGNCLDDNALVIYNRSGIHSVCKKGKNLFLTLLNGSMYCAHPLEPKKSVVPDRTRFLNYIEQGEHTFEFRMRVNKVEECERFAKEFNEPVYGVSYFPHGNGKNITKNVVVLDNKNIVISALKKRNDKTFLIRLYNGSEKRVGTKLTIKGISKNVSLGKFEFKTFIFNDKTIVESKDSSIY